jgi:hypothetical protein
MGPENTFIKKGLTFTENKWSTRSDATRPELCERHLYRECLMGYTPTRYSERVPYNERLKPKGKPVHYNAELSAVEAKLNQIQKGFPGNSELRKYVNERISVAVCSWQLSPSHFSYLMVTWGCEPSVAKKWLYGATLRPEILIKACMWLLIVSSVDRIGWDRRPSFVLILISEPGCISRARH